MTPEAAGVRAVANSERDLYSKIYSNSQDSVFLITKEGKVSFANPRAVEDTSYEMEELQGIDFRSLFLPEEQGAIDTLLAATIDFNNGTDPQRVLKRKSGKKIFVEITSLAVEFEGQKTISCTVRDITARVKAEEKIRQYSKELEKINAELEDRVKARTQDLASANDKLQSTNELILQQKKEIDDVMNNIQQAIATVNREYKFNPEYSAFAKEVFGAKEIAGADIIDFLFEPGESRDQAGKNTREWLAMIFEDPSIWEMTKDFGLKEHRYLRPSAEGTPEIRDLKFEWRPIYGGTAIAKIMLVCIDVTEQKRLQAEIAKKDAEHQEELELISQLITVPYEIVEQFIADFDRNLKEGLDVLSKGAVQLGPEAFRGLLRNLHTIKGSARQFKLASIQGRAHQLEDRITNAAKQELPTGQALLKFYDEINADFSELARSLRSIVAIYDKVIHGGNGGASQGSSAGGGGAGAGMVPVSLQKVEALLDKAFSGSDPVPTVAVRKAISWLIQVPVRALFDRLEQLTKSLGTELNRKVEVVRVGDDVKIDYRAAVILYDAFLHVIRNSLDHGGETPEAREALGKHAELKLTFMAKALPDNYVSIEIGDDGKGIDADVVKRKVVEKKLMKADAIERYTMNEILHFVFLPGFSTREVTTDLSGRGVGLDVLKEAIEKTLRGEVSIESVLSEGTKIRARFRMDVFNKASVNNCFAIPATDEQKNRWELLIGTKLKPLESGTKISSNGITVVAADRLDTVREQPGYFESIKKIVCFDDLEPVDIISKALIVGGVRHFASVKTRNIDSYIRTTLKKVSGESPFTWGIEPYLWPTTPVKSFKLRNYGEKNKVIDELLQFASKLRAFSALPEILGTVADEMLMNAMFDAPRSVDGKAKYNHLSRLHPLILEPNEEVTFRFGADPNFVALSIQDPFGALGWKTLVTHIQKGFRQGTDQISKKKDGGAGLGLFMTFDNSHCLIVNSAHGKKTEMISLIALGRSYEEYQRGGKCFSFYEGVTE